MDYPNVPRVIGTLISARMATLHELSTIYGMADAYDLLEILQVDAHNKRAIESASNRDG